MAEEFDESDRPLISGLKEESDIFDRIRDTMKTMGNMFLFGNPTEDIMTLMLKIYHENLIRILMQKSKGYPSVECMIGILQLNDGSIYMTISEEPDEDSAYPIKLQTLFSILKQSNVEVTIPEDDLRAKPSSVIGWRTPAGKDTYVSKVIKKNELQGSESIMLMNPLPSDVGATTTYNYDEDLWSMPMSINLINSEEYLRNRKTGNSFVPFKTYSKKKYRNVELFSCNSGSTCTEAKLFSYIHNMGKTFNDIKGFVAYWVGNKLPPEHIKKSYSFSSQDTFENKKLNDLVKQCIPYLSPSIQEIINKYNDKSFNVLKNVVNPLALACPGCVANYVPYKTNKISQWDNSRCLNITNRPTSGGGKMMSKKMKKTHKRKSHRRRSSHLLNKKKYTIKKRHNKRK